jgi:hypothetical protein
LSDYLLLGGLAGSASGSVLPLDSEASLTAPHAIKPIATTATAPPPIYFLFLQVHLQQLFAVSMYSLKPKCLLISSFAASLLLGTILISSLGCSVVVHQQYQLFALYCVYCMLVELEKVIDISSAISFFIVKHTNYFQYF